MAIYLRIAGVDKDGYLSVNTGRLSGDINRRWQFSGTVEELGTDYRPSRGQTVQIDNNAGTKYFAGNIARVIERRKPGTGDGTDGLPRRVYDIEAWDFNHITARRFASFESENSSLYAIVSLVATNFLYNEGITLTGVENPGPTITEKLSFAYETVESVFNKLSAITGYFWYIDFDKVLHFSEFTSNPAPISLTEDSENWRDIEVEVSDEDYRNRQHVRTDLFVTTSGGSASATPTEPAITAFTGQDVYYTAAIVKEMKSIKVNGVAKTFYGVPSGGNIPGTGYDFYYLIGSQGFFGLDWGPASGGETITCDYLSETNPYMPANIADSAVPGIRVVTRNDLTEQAARSASDGGSGIWEALAEFPNILGVAALKEIGDGLIRRFGTTAKRVRFESDTTGLLPGQRITITIPHHNLSGSFLIEAVDIDILATWEGDFFRTRCVCTSHEPFGKPIAYLEKVVEMARGGGGGGSAGGMLSTIGDLGDVGDASPNAPQVASATVEIQGYDITQDTYNVLWLVNIPTAGLTNFRGFRLAMERSDASGTYIDVTGLIPASAFINGQYGTSYAAQPIRIASADFPATSINLAFRVISENAAGRMNGASAAGGSITSAVWSAGVTPTGSPLSMVVPPGLGKHLYAESSGGVTRISGSVTHEGLDNGDFEAGFSGWSTLGSPVVTTTAGEMRSGLRAIKGTYFAVYQEFTARAGDRIYAESYVKEISSCSQLIGMLVGAYEADGDFISWVCLMQTDTAASWTKLYDSGACPANTAKIRFYAAWSDASETGTWAVDDARLVIQRQETADLAGGYTVELLVGSYVGTDSETNGAKIARSDGLYLELRYHGWRLVEPGGVEIARLYTLNYSGDYAPLLIFRREGDANHSFWIEPGQLGVGGGTGEGSASLAVAPSVDPALYMSGNKVVTLRQAAIADLAGGATLAEVISKVNAILAMLRVHGLIAT